MHCYITHAGQDSMHILLGASQDYLEAEADYTFNYQNVCFLYKLRMQVVLEFNFNNNRSY